MDIRTVTDLKRHSKRVGDHFFSKGASESLKTVSIEGIYRAPYTALSEGYVITVNRYENGDTHAYVYVFEATDEGVKWYPLDRHPSLKDAESFLAAMNVRK